MSSYQIRLTNLSDNRECFRVDLEGNFPSVAQRFKADLESTVRAQDIGITPDDYELTLFDIDKSSPVLASVVIEKALNYNVVIVTLSGKEEELWRLLPPSIHRGSDA